MSEYRKFLVEVGDEGGWVMQWQCDTMEGAEKHFQDCAGDGKLVRIQDTLTQLIVKQGGGPQGYSPHPGKGKSIGTHCRDLVNVPQQHTQWINVNKIMHNCVDVARHSYPDHRTANLAASPERIACIEVTFVEGEGLE